MQKKNIIQEFYMLKYYRLDILRYITKLEITKIMLLRKTADSFFSSLRYFINTQLNIFIMSLVQNYNPSESVSAMRNIHRNTILEQCQYLEHFKTSLFLGGVAFIISFNLKAIF